MSENIVIYSAVFGSHEKAMHPPLISNGVPHICFTDGCEVSPPWQAKMIQPSEPTPRRDARKIKALSHVYLPDADYSIWIDGNLDIRVGVDEMLSWLNGNDIAIRLHEESERGGRNNLWGEIEACRRRFADEPLDAQGNFYRGEGCPEKHNLLVSQVVIRRHTPEIKRFNEEWWSQMKRFSCRDQISLPYVLWKLGIKCSLFPMSYRQSLTRFNYYRHGSLPSGHGSAQAQSVTHSNPKNKNIAVVIPALGKSAYLVETVHTLFANNQSGVMSGYNVVVIIVNNGLDGGTLRDVEAEISSSSRPGWSHSIINNPKNMYVTDSWNQGITEAVRKYDADYVMVANSDLHFGQDVLLRCVQAIDKYDLYQVTPQTCHIPGGPLPKDFATQDRQAANRAFGYGQEIISIDNLDGWCFMLSRKCLDEVGWFDPRFLIHRGDTDYGIRIKQKSRMPIILQNCLIHHYRHQTLNEIPNEVREITQEDSRLYHRKYAGGTNAQSQKARA